MAEEFGEGRPEGFGRRVSMWLGNLSGVDELNGRAAGGGSDPALADGRWPLTVLVTAAAAEPALLSPLVVNVWLNDDPLGRPGTVLAGISAA